MDNQLIISVKEARKILGKPAREMTDEQIEEVIRNLDAIARYYVKGVMDGSIKLPLKE